MKDSSIILDFEENEQSFNLKAILFKYLKHWPWFLFGVFLCMCMAYTYLRYAPIIYTSSAKIKIVDDSKEMSIAMDPSALFGGSNINLDNEVEVLKSYRLLSQVVEALDLGVSYYEVGDIKTRELWKAPFSIRKPDSLEVSRVFLIQISTKGIKITDEKEKVITVSIAQQNEPIANLPFTIELAKDINFDLYKETTFKVVLSSKRKATMQLMSSLGISPGAGKYTEILVLSMASDCPEKNEAILNEVINKFNRDGILDRQLVSQRTLDFIDERFVYLSTELDSIEVGKQDFKQSNELSYINADAEMTLQNKSITENELANLQTQISISKLLKETVQNQADYNLLPAEIGVDNGSLNALVNDFNKLALERDKLILSVGENHPTLQAINAQLARGKVNILKTVNVYQAQLRTSLNQLTQERNRAGSLFSKLPEKEKMLRAIERQQSIKENLFLLLLQKREEAAINLAVTAPSVKVVDYGLTNGNPISPKKILIYAFALVLGLLIPFAFFYAKFLLDTKIHDRADLEKINPEIPIVAEIPFLKDKKSFTDVSDRSILAESFRILSTNVNYLLPKKEQGVGQVIYVTSTIKGEGKSLTAFNLSLAYASINKKVLLVGADLRNPQLHNYFDVSKNVAGLVDYLHDPKIDISDCIHQGFGKNPNHKICFSGPIPPNAPELLSGPNFEKFINEVSMQFDYVIVDTAPTILVTDTLLIANYADITLFVTRANFTEKEILAFSKDLYKNHKMKNMAYIVNEVGLGKAKDYNYGYGYGYTSTE